MNVTKISNGITNVPNLNNYQPKELAKADSGKVILKTKIDEMDSVDIKQKNIWQKDILLSALDKLENNIHLENNHPLDFERNQPIETFEEALIELSFVRTPLFKAEALNAQANISPSSIWELFIDEPELVN